MKHEACGRYRAQMMRTISGMITNRPHSRPAGVKSLSLSRFPVPARLQYETSPVHHEKISIWPLS